MTGEFIGIGVGPGDPELLTIKAVKTLQRCDLLALPVKDKEQCYAYQIAVQAVPQICDKPSICLDFPMSKDVSVLDAKMKENAEEIISWLNKDMRIAFLTIGDPTVYATYHYVHRIICEQGYQAQIISGIPSFLAVAARLGISLADREEQIHVIPGSYDIEDAKTYPGTRIYMKSGKKLQYLKEGLQREVMEGKQLEVYVVSNCGMDSEKVMVGLDAWEEELPYLTTVLVKDVALQKK